MRLKKSECVEYQLTLSEKEAHWLRAVMQNPFGYGLRINPAINSEIAHLEDESEEDCTMRCKFFELLNSRLEKYKHFKND